MRSKTARSSKGQTPPECFIELGRGLCLTLGLTAQLLEFGL
jgi:hypothetical protein